MARGWATSLADWRMLAAQEAQHWEIMKAAGYAIGQRGEHERQCFDDMVKFFDLIELDAEAHREIIRKRLRASAPELASESEPQARPPAAEAG
jgi:hypothetical protein